MLKIDKFDILHLFCFRNMYKIATWRLGFGFKRAGVQPRFQECVP